nr:hypothetical protein L204_02456 [Cryptococcus depauperatus CBS 7855]
MAAKKAEGKRRLSIHTDTIDKKIKHRHALGGASPKSPYASSTSSNGGEGQQTVQAIRHAASTGTSRHSSPPGGFNLSSGQPLVNPPPKTQAAFVGKLYSMLEDEEIAKTGLIYWSAEGKTFTCPNPTEFSKVVLPRYFKHNNWQSFVRQLNMYSFNKVNDIYSTTTDPQAWEFRHSLFRRGEPLLLPSIKRKSSRPTHDGLSLTSPTEDPPDMSKAVAGWMRDPYRTVSSPHSQQSSFYPYNDLGARKDDRPPSRGGMWERQPRMLPPSDTPPPVRFHPDPSRPPLPAQRYHPMGYPESPIYGQSPMMDSLLAQVAMLEERVQRLQEVLNNDRVEHVRSSLDFTSYLLQMVGWAAGERHSPEIRALQDTLSRQNADMRQKYEAFMASDALATMASGGGRERDSLSREREGGKGARREYERPPMFPAYRSTPIPDTRLPQTARSGSATVPRTPPVNSYHGEQYQARMEGARDNFVNPPPPHQVQGLGFHAGPVYMSRSSAAYSAFVNGPSVPPPPGYRGITPDERDYREVDKREQQTDSLSTIDRRRDSEREEIPPTEEKKSKAGLKNLLN